MKLLRATILLLVATTPLAAQRQQKPEPNKQTVQRRVVLCSTLPLKYESNQPDFRTKALPQSLSKFAVQLSQAVRWAKFEAACPATERPWQLSITGVDGRWNYFLDSPSKPQVIRHANFSEAKVGGEAGLGLQQLADELVLVLTGDLKSDDALKEFYKSLYPINLHDGAKILVQDCDGIQCAVLPVSVQEFGFLGVSQFKVDYRDERDFPASINVKGTYTCAEYDAAKHIGPVTLPVPVRNLPKEVEDHLKAVNLTVYERLVDENEECPPSKFKVKAVEARPPKVTEH